MKHQRGISWSITDGLYPRRALHFVKFGRSRVSLVVGVEIGSERYPSGIMWFSTWIAGPIEEEIIYDLSIAF